MSEEENSNSWFYKLKDTVKVFREETNNFFSQIHDDTVEYLQTKSGRNSESSQKNEQNSSSVEMMFTPPFRIKFRDLIEDSKTYTESPDSENLKNVDLNQDIEKLQAEPAIQAMFSKLVPGTVSEDEFWERVVIKFRKLVKEMELVLVDQQQDDSDLQVDWGDDKTTSPVAAKDEEASSHTTPEVSASLSQTESEQNLHRSPPKLAASTIQSITI